jgi:hypothetical protein
MAGLVLPVATCALGPAAAATSMGSPLTMCEPKAERDIADGFESASIQLFERMGFPSGLRPIEWSRFYILHPGRQVVRMQRRFTIDINFLSHFFIHRLMAACVSV